VGTRRAKSDTGQALEKQSGTSARGGIRLIAVSQGIDSDNEQAQVLVTVHGMVDSLYVKELAKKTHRGLEGLVLRGQHAGGRCYGYDSAPVDGATGSLVDEVPVGTIITDRPRTDLHERSLAHADLISDEWRRSDRRANDGAHEVEEAIVWPA
jgi:hypothetical protein